MTELRRTRTIYRSFHPVPYIPYIPAEPSDLPFIYKQVVPYYLERPSTSALSTINTKVGTASREAARTLAMRLRVPANEVVAPMITENVALFPSGLIVRDKCSIVKVGRSTLRIKYEGEVGDAVLVKANCTVPTECGVYYFEVDIVSKGGDGELTNLKLN
ncbi:Ran-binding protein 9 [Nowakowskiella sp. JEL0078]|nr:Ran-binding protein 9 [Nowakowskiella sp. JEL0078]